MPISVEVERSTELRTRYRVYVAYSLLILSSMRSNLSLELEVGTRTERGRPPPESVFRRGYPRSPFRPTGRSHARGGEAGSSKAFTPRPAALSLKVDLMPVAARPGLRRTLRRDRSTLSPARSISCRGEAGIEAVRRDRAPFRRQGRSHARSGEAGTSKDFTPRPKHPFAGRSICARSSEAGSSKALRRAEHPFAGRSIHARSGEAESSKAFTPRPKHPFGKVDLIP